MSKINDIEVNEPEANYRTGWISIYRSIMNKSWYRKSEYVHLWIHILLSASHQESEFWFNGGPVKIKRGQFITGRKLLSVNSGISESKVERILKCFENEQQIEQQTTNKNRLITVLNYDSYQVGAQQIEQQLNNKRTTTEQQLDTYNNINNYNKGNNENKDLTDFDKFWNAYDHKVGKEKCQRKWGKLSKSVKEQIMEYVPKYVEATPNKKYRKHPMTFLNGKSWEDELPASVKKENNHLKNATSL